MEGGKVERSGCDNLGERAGWRRLDGSNGDDETLSFWKYFEHRAKSIILMIWK